MSPAQHPTSWQLGGDPGGTERDHRNGLVEGSTQQPGPGGVGPRVPASLRGDQVTGPHLPGTSVVPLEDRTAPRLGKTGGWGVRHTPPSEAIFPAPHPTWPFHFLCSVFTAYAIPSFIHEPTVHKLHDEALGPQKRMCSWSAGPQRGV